MQFGGCGGGRVVVSLPTLQKTSCCLVTGEADPPSMRTFHGKHLAKCHVESFWASELVQTLSNFNHAGLETESFLPG